MSDTAIADYALLSDCHSAGLVSRDGSVDWLCLNRFDGPSTFARLLDDRAGHWSIRALGPAKIERRYLDRTLVLQTDIEVDGGRATVTDAMVMGSAGAHDLGRDAPHVLARQVTTVEGEVSFEMEFAPRAEYGLIRPLLAAVDGGVRGRGGAAVLALSSSLPLHVEESTATVRFTLVADEGVSFALQRRASWEDEPRLFSERQIERMLGRTTEAWRSWSGYHQNYEGPWADLVYHSGSVLQGLTYQPTGAIVAAPTTSIPEAVGGVRNWDYRYAWVRDASLTLQALWVAACPDEANEFFAWMAGAAASELHEGQDLQIMFGVGGEHDLTERELPHLSGWRGSRPVRIGNGAWEQRQIDVYGELLDAAFLLRDRLGELELSTRHLLADAADAAAARWTEPDHGIWEIRGQPRHFLYSKLMCWVALDRAIQMAEVIEAADRVERWEKTRKEIRTAILEQGWSEEAGAFTQAFGSQELDASALMLPVVGFLPGDDHRVRSTIRAIEERLTDDRGLVYRYRADDGLPGDEGTFLLCTFWLAQAHAIAGDPARARETFERAASHRNDVGLLAEEVHPGTGELLGNFPQAFSHIGLVNAAWAIVKAEARA